MDYDWFNKPVIETFKLNEPTIQKTTNLLSKLLRKRYNKSLMTSVINSPMSPHFMFKSTLV